MLLLRERSVARKLLRSSCLRRMKRLLSISIGLMFRSFTVFMKIQKQKSYNVSLNSLRTFGYIVRGTANDVHPRHYKKLLKQLQGNLKKWLFQR